MISEANLDALQAVGLSFILGTRIPFLPDVVREWRDRHPPGIKRSPTVGANSAPGLNATGSSSSPGRPRTVNRELEAKNRRWPAGRVMPTNLVGQPAEFVIDAYHQLWRIDV